MDLETKSDAEILTIADPIRDNLMEASTAFPPRQEWDLLLQFQKKAQ